jgi:formylglycine-generating enzyme required for sulfatase activity
MPEATTPPAPPLSPKPVGRPNGAPAVEVAPAASRGPKHKGLIAVSAAAGALLLGLVALWASGVLSVKSTDRSAGQPSQAGAGAAAGGQDGTEAQPPHGGEVREDGKVVVLDLGGGVKMELVRIPRGEFLMGSPEDDKVPWANNDNEKPQHEVEITRPFYLGKYEVTRGQFRRFVADAEYQTEAEKDGLGGGFRDQSGAPKGPRFDPKTGERSGGETTDYSWRKTGFAQTDEHPVVNVTWNDAVAFCRWLARKSGKSVRLPSEAEWEYACRAGTTTLYYNGDDAETLAEVGNVADGTARKRFSAWSWAIKAEDGYVFTAPVGQFKPNRFGLFDMHGNVREWCQDWYDADYYASRPKRDPQGPNNGLARVLRGGAWDNPRRGIRAAARGANAPANRSDSLGFRVAFNLK